MKATPEHPYPETFEDFLDWFQSEEDCRDYLAWIRWGNGFSCPKCEGREFWKTGDGLWCCRQCGRRSSVRAGTVFDDGRKPLRTWFFVMWLLMAQRTGMSARSFQETFGFKSYQTAWGWLQKLRSVMVRAGREKLSGRIELDETYIGGQKEGARGRGAEGKTLVLVAVEGGQGETLGRVRFKILASASVFETRPFVSECIEEESTIETDAFKSYDFLDAMPYTHRKQAQSLLRENGEGESARTCAPRDLPSEEMVGRDPSRSRNTEPSCRLS